MKKLTLIGVFCLTLGGCAITPVQEGDSVIGQKIVSFPKIGQQVHAVVGGLVHLSTDYQSKHSFRLVKPFSIVLGMGKAVVSSDEIIQQSSLDGDVAFCTDSLTYQPYLGFANARACFRSTEKGKFNNVRLMPGIAFINKDIVPPIDYVSAEQVSGSGGKPLKRELIFDGGQNQTLLFTEKIYENSLETPSRSKPLMVKVELSPSKVTLNGAEINIISYTNNSLTYTLIKAWD